MSIVDSYDSIIVTANLRRIVSLFTANRYNLSRFYKNM